MMDKPADCELHNRSYSGKCNYTEAKCEGYCSSATDDEPVDQCKECKFNEFWEEG